MLQQAKNYNPNIHHRRCRGVLHTPLLDMFVLLLGVCDTPLRTDTIIRRQKCMLCLKTYKIDDK